MKKLFAVFAMIFAAVAFVGCAEEPVEEELAMEEAEEAFETAEPVGTTDITHEAGPDALTDTAETAMTDTTMTGDTAMTSPDTQ